jgi:hypothetical protein
MKPHVEVEPGRRGGHLEPCAMAPNLAAALFNDAVARFAAKYTQAA